MKILLASVFAMIGLLAVPAPVLAQELNSQVDCSGIENSEFCAAKDNEENTLFGENGVLTRVIVFLSVVVGAVSVVLIIIAGIRFINSNGDPQKVATAKNTVIYGAIGVALAAMAPLIVAFNRRTNIMEMYMKYLTRPLVIAVAVIGLALFVPQFALADAGDAVCEGAGQVAGGTCADTGGQISTLVQTGIRILQIIAGVMAVIYIIIAGLRYITSNGDSGKISSAKNAIIFACIGIAVVALSEVIIQFVLNRVASTSEPTEETSSLIEIRPASLSHSKFVI